MTPTIKQGIDSRLQRIANVLLLNASFIDNLGLLNGKMGIAIFFYQYARYTGNKIYEQYAGELIDEIYEEIRLDTPIDFANGLTGIGWGIEYLVRNDFVEADTDEALVEIDRIVSRSLLQKPMLFDNSEDMLGHGFYYLARLQGREQNDDDLKILQIKDSLIFLVDECERLLTHQKFVNYGIPEISIGTLNSLVYYLLEIHRLELFPVKVEKIFRYLLSNLCLADKNNNNYSDSITLAQFINKIHRIIIDKDYRNQYQDLHNQLTNCFKSAYLENESWVIKEFTKTIWHSILYPVTFNGEIYHSLTEKAISLIDDEKNWVKRLDSLNNNNLSLNSGVAGLGLALLNKNMKVTKQSVNMPISKINDELLS